MRIGTFDDQRVRYFDHLGRNIAVKIVDRHDWTIGTDQLANSLQNFAIGIVDPLGGVRSMQAQEYTVNRHRPLQASQQIFGECFKGFASWWSPSIRLGPGKWHELQPVLANPFHKTVDNRVRVTKPRQIVTADGSPSEFFQRRRFGNEAGRFVFDAAHGDASGHAFSLYLASDFTILHVLDPVNQVPKLARSGFPVAGQYELLIGRTEAAGDTSTTQYANLSLESGFIPEPSALYANGVTN